MWAYVQIEWRETENWESPYSDWYSHYQRIGPENTVLVEIVGGIEPEIISLFSADADASIPVNIGLHPPIFASDVSQEFEIDFVMTFLEYIAIWHLK